MAMDIVMKSSSVAQALSDMCISLRGVSGIAIFGYLFLVLPFVALGLIVFFYFRKKGNKLLEIVGLLIAIGAVVFLLALIGLNLLFPTLISTMFGVPSNC